MYRWLSYQLHIYTKTPFMVFLCKDSIIRGNAAGLYDDLKTRFEHGYPGIRLCEETDHYLTEAIAA
ncbi:hypothetical protein C5470_02535 [Photorhabdus stackebrandtii]|uniref:Uncharacterized protein n=1 Tax=Photorhabdus stackebrandtii TaxID=1123042 RepID=A0A7X5QJD7_9GAMM|nr:hypothetical protein [Photorhabdus stackebrandtii]